MSLSKACGPELYRLIEGCSWGMKESQEMQQKIKVKTDQEVLVMSRVGGPRPQGKGWSWRINRWQNSILFSRALVHLRTNTYFCLFSLPALFFPAVRTILSLQHFQLICGLYNFTIVAFFIPCYSQFICSQLASSRFLLTRDSSLFTHAEHPPLFVNGSTSSSWSIFTILKASPTVQPARLEGKKVRCPSSD